MTDLPPELHALLSKARTQHDPSADDAERVRARLYASLAVASLPGSKQALAGKAGSSSVLSAQLATKLVVAALVVGGGAGWWALRPRPSAPRPAPPAAAAVASPEPTRALPEPQKSAASSELGSSRAALQPSPPRSQEPELAADGPESARAPVKSALEQPKRAPAKGYRGRAGQLGVLPRGSHVAAQATPGEATAATPPESDRPAPSADEPTRQEELGLLRTALEAINGGRPARALAVLESHALRYPGSVLAEERSGLRVLALCGLHDLAAGRREQQAFLRDHAKSPLAARVRGACVAGPSE